ncbi:MAG: hypothetical protein PGN07_02940 [Aeromicrobium erythreum]
MTTQVIPAEILAFARAVRAELADLHPEEIEELTGGLEADLTESYAEDLRRELPAPAVYAAELRTAAGLPHRASKGTGLLSLPQDTWRAAGDVRRRVAESIRENPTGADVLDFLSSVRPVWWVLRAFVAAWVLSELVGNGYFTWFWFGVALVGAAISVQLGRGRLGARRVPFLILVGDVIAVLLLMPLLGQLTQEETYYDDSMPMAEQSSQGVTLDGASVTNIFAYDAKGRPLQNVQLFDQDGKPLVPRLDTMRDECLDAECTVAADGQQAAPRTLETGAQVGNVFPLSFFRRTMLDGGALAPETGPATPPKAPFVKVPAVQPEPAR